MVWLFLGALALIVILGSMVIVIGGRLMKPSAGAVAFVFAVTAASWVALIVVAISLIMRNFTSVSL